MGRPTKQAPPAMMARSTLLFAASCLVSCGIATAKPAWQRVWTVTRIICPHCTSATRTTLQDDIGTKISIAPNRFINPLYESCRTGVDYSKMQNTTAAIAQASMPNLPPLHAGFVTSGTIGCALPNGPPNIIARFVFDGTTGYYLYEGGAVLQLH